MTGVLIRIVQMSRLLLYIRVNTNSKRTLFFHADPVFVPNITATQADTGGQPVTDGICFVRCSVKNSPNVTLSWYRGEEEINQTKNPDISIHLTLPLTIQRQNEAIYTCKAENPVSSETATLNSTLWCPAHGTGMFVLFFEEDCRVLFRISKS